MLAGYMLVSIDETSQFLLDERKLRYDAFLQKGRDKEHSIKTGKVTSNRVDGSFGKVAARVTNLTTG